MKERFELLYSELETLLTLAPIESECADQENIVYLHMANLKEALFNAGYSNE